MKIKFLTFGIIAASAMMTACSSDEPIVDNGASSSKGDVYMSFTLVNTSDGARSRSETQNNGTSDAGVEIGTDAENTINSVHIYLVSEGTSFASATVSSSQIKAGEDKTYVATFKSSELEKYADKDVDVMVYVNFTEKEYVKDQTNTGHSWGSEDISAAVAGKFQMSNADIKYTFTIPSNISSFTTETNPCNIGTINVERAAARIDIANGGYSSNGSPTTDNKYFLSDVAEGDVYITLDSFALINMSKNWYAIRRVSSDAPLATNSEVTLAGVETATNWVVDTDWDTKSSWATPSTTTTTYDNTTDITSNFDYPLATPSTWKYTAFTELTTDDNNDIWNSEGTNKTEYKVWRYLNENTIPGVANQKHGISTGVVFKGKLEATDKNIAQDMTDGKTLYVFQNRLYGSIERVAACKETDAALADAYSQCVGEDETVDKAKAAAAGFTGYSPVKEKDSNGNDTNVYYVYYYYWIRHNDNGQPSNMGTMEFAIVRNNVYKLQVTKIQKLGHPTPGGEDPDPDPDPVDPDDPDEDNEVYFKVSMKVMPWVVRINEIEF